MFYNESNQIYNENYAFGVTVILNNIDKNHPLFKNLDLSQISPNSYDGNVLRIRWWGGPAFERNGIAFYSQEICQMDNAKLHVWKFVGKNATDIGLPENVLQNFTNPTYKDLLDYTIWLGRHWNYNDWEDYVKLPIYINTSIKGLGAIAYATYGNGKVLAIGPHPEDSIWNGGQIVEAEDTSHNSLSEGLYHWEGYADIDKYANHWIIIRGVAFVAGVPENELPYTKINHVPNQPDNPSPANGETNVDINPTLRWQSSDPDGDTLTYDVYFGTTTNPPLVASDLPVASYNPGTLEYGTTYYWKVVAKDAYGGIAVSSLWHFTTQSEPSIPSPPKPPGGGDNLQ